MKHDTLRTCDMKTPLEILKLYSDHDYTLWGAFQSRARRDPQRTFIAFDGGMWSWEDFGRAVERAARALAAKGIARGDRVGVMGPNSDGHVLMLFALARLGAIMVPINPEFGIQEARAFNDAEQEVFPGCPELRDGYYWASDKPGLGIDLDERAAARFPIQDDPPFDFQWGNLRRKDGTVTKP